MFKTCYRYFHSSSWPDFKLVVSLASARLSWAQLSPSLFVVFSNNLRKSVWCKFSCVVIESDYIIHSMRVSWSERYYYILIIFLVKSINTWNTNSLCPTKVSDKFFIIDCCPTQAFMAPICSSITFVASSISSKWILLRWAAIFFCRADSWSDDFIILYWGGDYFQKLKLHICKQFHFSLLSNTRHLSKFFSHFNKNCESYPPFGLLHLTKIWVLISNNTVFFLNNN